MKKRPRHTKNMYKEMETARQRKADIKLWGEKRNIPLQNRGTGKNTKSEREGERASHRKTKYYPPT